ncbi:hypothetical protein I552_2399 [Mycobacterium xenopi 3993]|nr:hypothetical protein I552_2399 [Mycobacterium xenopi 3993]
MVGFVLLDPFIRQLGQASPIRSRWALLNTSAAITSPTKMVFSSLSSDPVIRHST